MYKIIPVPDFDFLLFGATGDLARREILPALYRRFQVGQMPAGARVVGVSRSPLSNGEFRQRAADAVAGSAGDGQVDRVTLRRFLECLSFRPLDGREKSGWAGLAELLRPGLPRAFYLSVAPSLYSDIVHRLGSNRLIDQQSRIVVEKPFGQDLATSRQLNAALTASFDETQIYRIDHYLGKETVQNLMALRFANALFEPLWNSQHIDHVQITVAESLGIEGRSEFYDRTGAMRDMVQNHLMQLLCLVAMEPPARFGPDEVRNEKVKVIKALEPVPPKAIIRGQYVGSRLEDGYLCHANAESSTTESYVALKCGIANWRWAGTPFYLRTGKRLRERLSEVAVVFRKPPHAIFDDMHARPGNVLAIRLQPDEGIDMQITIKEPGPGGMRLADVPMDMSFADSVGTDYGPLINAYERLIMDVIRGDQTLFMRSDEVEAAWRWTDDISGHWAGADSPPDPYLVGSHGPETADELLLRDGRRWREIAL